MAKRPREASEVETCNADANDAPSTPAPAPPVGAVKAEYGELRLQRNANHAAQIDHVLSSSPPVNQPVPSVDAVMAGLGTANVVIGGGTGYTVLHQFVCVGHIAGIKALLAAGADPNFVDYSENMPLHLAAMYGRVEAVRALAAARGADLERRNAENDTPLLVAVNGLSDNDEVAEALIEAGADVNVRSHDENGHNWRSALHIAAAGGHIGCVKALLAAHADVHVTDACGRSPLNSACCRDVPVSVIELLLEAGSDIESADRAGSTPLVQATLWGNTSALSYLISKGANINARRNDGKTALLRAVEDSELECARILLKAGADVTIADNSGLTPAKAAMDKEDSAEMLQLLLSGGAVTVKREASS